MIRIKKITILYTLLGLLCLPGCDIKDELNLCHTDLYFSYLGDGTEEIFLDKTGRVNLYVYDVAGQLIRTVVLNKGDLLKKQGVTLNLPPGKYHVVCWGNAYANTEIIDQSSLITGTVASPDYFERTTILTNDSLYYGSRDIEYTGREKNKVDTVHFNSAHIKMLIDISGLEDMRLPDGSSPIRIQMGNLSPAVSFEEVFSRENISYFPISQYSDNTSDYESRFNVLRFSDDNDVYINLINTDTEEVIYTLPLKDFMQEHEITVDGINEIQVGIRFTFNGMAITIQPWDEKTITPGYQN